MPTSIEAQGVTVEEAIQVALNQLGVTRDRVEIEIIHHPRSGFLGIGARRAKVRATVREAFLADGEEYDMSTGTSVGRGGRRNRRSRRRRGRRGEGRQETTEQPSRRPEPRESRGLSETRGRSETRRDDSRGDRQRDRRQPKERRGRESTRGGDEPSRREDTSRREERRPQPQREPRQQGRSENAARPPEPAPAAREREAGPPMPRPREREAEPAAARSQFQEGAGVAPGREMEEAEGQEYGEPQGARTNVVPTEEVRRRGETVVRELLKRMGFQATVSSFVDSEEGEVVVKVDADAEGLLIGRRGQTLDAVEHLVNRMVLSGDNAAEARVAVDVGGYRRRRRDTLLELADRLKVRALTQGRRIQVSPMSPRDRRILQGALSRDDTVRTRVLGTGFYRRVLIFPVGLDEAAMPLEHEHEQEEEVAEAQIGVEEDEGA